MVPSNTRRALLRAGSSVATVALAGCYFGPTDPRDATPLDENGDDAGTGSGGRNGTGSDDDGSAGDGTPTPEPTRSFSFVVKNTLTAEQLEVADGLSADTPAEILIDVEAHYDDREETAFEQTVELPPGEKRTIADAFTTKVGPEYVIRTVLKGKYAEHTPDSWNRSAGYRFTPGGFGGPTGTTFELTVFDVDDEHNETDKFIPVLGMSVPE